MKHITALLLCAALCLAVSGCGVRTMRPVPPALPDSFSCEVHITADDMEIDAVWSASHGDSVFTVRAPAELRGVTVRCTADGGTMALDGVETVLADASPFMRIAGAYRVFMTSAPEGTLTSGGWLYDMRQSGCTVLQDAESGVPLRISMPEQGVILMKKEQSGETR